MKDKLSKNTMNQSNEQPIQTILGADGKPSFVVIPYQYFVEHYDTSLSLVPNEVIVYAKSNDVSAIRAWREHLGFKSGDSRSKDGLLYTCGIAV